MRRLVIFEKLRWWGERDWKKRCTPKAFA